MKRISFDYCKLLRRCFIYTYLKNVEKEAANLLFFCFTKKVVHRGKEQEIKIPRLVKDEEVIKLIPCLHCPLKFKTLQGLSIHIKCKHAR